MTNSYDQIEAVLIQGDLSRLSAEQRVEYYRRLTASLGLNALTRPFEYLNLSGKLVLYATKSCSEQLRQLHGVSITSISGQRIDDVYIVTAAATDKNGRTDCSTGAVNLAGLKAEALCNAFMKAETKAKRRVTLSLCSLAILDETEIETIPNAIAYPANNLPATQLVAGIRDAELILGIDDLCQWAKVNYPEAYPDASAVKAMLKLGGIKSWTRDTKVSELMTILADNAVTIDA